MSVGYCSINSISLDVNGELVAQAQEGIFITEVNYVTNNNANVADSKIIGCYQSLLNRKIVLSDTDVNSSITYSIAVYNSYGIDFSYIKTVYNESFYDNENIVFDLVFDDGKSISSNNKLTFTITFRYNDGIVPSSSNNELNSSLKFIFLHPVNYIESTGIQFIDTGINPDNTTAFEMSFSLNDLEVTQAIFGTRVNMDKNPYFNMFLYKHSDYENHRVRWDENTEQVYADLPYSVGGVINVVNDTKNITFSMDDTIYSADILQEEWSLDSSIYIFNQNQVEVAETRCAIMNLYYLKIYKNDVIVRDFIPTLDENGVACLYDLVSYDYFYNVGMGEFLYN